MLVRTIWLRVLPLLAFLAVFAHEARAHAGRGIILITSGDSITKVGDLDAEVGKEVEAELGAGVEVGYKYEQFGLFFVEVWTWDGKFVLFRGDEYWELDDEHLAAAAGVESVDALKKPLTYTVPPGLIGVAVLAIGFVAFTLLRKKDDDDADEVAHEVPPTPVIGHPSHDPRYQQAVHTYAQVAATAPDQAFAYAVQQLMSQGIPQQEAQANLAHLLGQRGAMYGQAQAAAQPW